MTLTNKIDFAVIFSVKNANPNGDPLNGNRPRTTLDGIGEISDVCLKRKIRDRLMDMGESIFVQSDDKRKDEFTTLKNRADAILKEKLSKEDTAKKACAAWFDVRAFGQVLAFKADKKAKKGKDDKEDKEDKGKDDKGVSIGIRGPISIHPAFSLEPVDISSIQITKSVSNEGDGTQKSSDTMGMKYRVDSGNYVFLGTINPQLASLTGFSDKDAEIIKAILPRLFEGDASSARPEGSMAVNKVIWWKHNCANGQYSSAKVHACLNSTAIASLLHSDKPVKTSDITLNNLACEIIDGF